MADGKDASVIEALKRLHQQLLKHQSFEMFSNLSFAMMADWPFPCPRIHLVGCEFTFSQAEEPIPEAEWPEPPVDISKIVDELINFEERQESTSAEPAVVPAVVPAVEPAVVPAVVPAVEPAVVPAAEPAAVPAVVPVVVPPKPSGSFLDKYKTGGSLLDRFKAGGSFLDTPKAGGSLLDTPKSSPPASTKREVDPVMESSAAINKMLQTSIRSFSGPAPPAGAGSTRPLSP
eukprot:1190331-Prorocentrum_minimum.AAC.1